MSKTGKFIALAVGLILALMTTLALAADKPATPAPAKPAETAKKLQTTCPITGKPIDKSLFVDKDGKRIYVCCPHCPDAVKKDFDKYAKELEGKGIDLTIPKEPAKPGAVKPMPAKPEPAKPEPKKEAPKPEEHAM